MEKVKRFYSNPGDILAPKHAIRIDDLGHKTLVDTGEKTNIYEKIQSHKDECDIEKILERSQVEGYEILNKREVMSGDVTMVPESLLQASQMLQDRENEFNQLPIDIRRKFNFSFNEYIAQAGNDIEVWAEKMGIVKAAVEDTITPEQTPDNEGGEK